MVPSDSTRRIAGQLFWRLAPIGLLAALIGAWNFLSQTETDPRGDGRPEVPGIAAYQAIDELVAAGGDGVPELMKRLKSDDPAIRKNAAFALGRIGEPAATAVPALCPLLDDPVASVRTMALEALGRIGVGLEKLAPAAALRLADTNSDVRESAAHFLIAAGPAAEPLALAALRHPRLDTRQKALLVLRRVAVDEEAVRRGLDQLYNEHFEPDEVRADNLELLLALSHPPIHLIQQGLISPRVRTFDLAWSAASGLVEYPHVFSSFVAFSLTQISFHDGRYLSADQFNESFGRSLPPDVILASLLEMGPEGKATTPFLRSFLRKDYLPRARWVAGLRVLVRFGEDPDEFIPELLSLWKTTLSRDALEVASVPHLGEAFREILPEHIPELFDDLLWRLDANQEAAAARSFLMELGPAAAPLLPEALRRLRSNDLQAVRTAHLLLRVMRESASEATPALFERIERAPETSEGQYDVAAAAETLLRIAPASAHRARPRLIAFFRTDERLAGSDAAAADRCSTALDLLRRIDSENPELVGCLRQAAANSNRDLRRFAVEMLVDMHREPDLAARTLTAELEEISRSHDPSRPDKTSPIRVLAKLGPQAAIALRPLVKALRMENLRDRLYYVEALGAVASPDLSEEDRESAVDALALQLNDPAESVRKATVKAILAFGSSARNAIPALETARQQPSNSVPTGYSPYSVGFFPYATMGRAFSRYQHRSLTVRELIDSALLQIRPPMANVERGFPLQEIEVRFAQFSGE